MGKKYHFPVTKNPMLDDFNYSTLISLQILNSSLRWYFQTLRKRIRLVNLHNENPNKWENSVDNISIKTHF